MMGVRYAKYQRYSTLDWYGGGSDAATIGIMI